jgi:hypothetical protein
LETHADELTPVEIGDVRVTGEVGRRIEATIEHNLLAVDVDRDFLTPFYSRNQQGGYVGLGKLIDALARFAAYAKDARVTALRDRVTGSILGMQEADGYIGTFAPDSRMWTLWDLHEMAYLVYGLVTEHRYSGEERPLAAACRLADYIVRRWKAEPNGKFNAGGASADMAALGLDLALLRLYEQTKNESYLEFVTKQRGLAAWDAQIVCGRFGLLEGHAYAFLNRCLAQLRLYRLTRDRKLLSQTKEVLDFFKRRDGLVITGTCGQHECWHDTQDGTMNLGETCTTAYLIRLLDDLLRLECDPRYGDMMERAIRNALFAAQSTDGRYIRYYTPFDGPRSYFSTDTYCCPNNFRRIMSELPAMIYYTTGSGVAINLYTPSKANIKVDRGITVEVSQETDYPNSGEVLIRLNPSRSAVFPVLLRIPTWCPRARIAVNGKLLNEEIKPGTFFAIDRKWETGNTIHLDMFMAMRLVRGRKAQAGRVAVMHGPLLFGLNRAKHPKLAGVDLRLLTLVPTSIEDWVRDQTLRPDGLGCHVRAWGPGAWYPHAAPGLDLMLSEYPDPGAESVYFNVPNPDAAGFVDDELSV